MIRFGLCALVFMLIGAGLSAAAPAASNRQLDGGASDAGVADGGFDFQRAHEEMLSALPGPLRFGEFHAEPGAWVRYALKGTDGRTVEVRAGLVGLTETATGPLYQLEFDFQSDPRVLYVLWVRERAARVYFAEKLAIEISKDTPISLPLDVKLGTEDLRGVREDLPSTPIRSGPFAGEARSFRFRGSAGDTSVTRSVKVPLFGVQHLSNRYGEWTAVEAGTGAAPKLKQVPLHIQTPLGP